MASPKISVGLYVPAQPPLGFVRQLIWAARLFRLDSVMIPDHFQDWFPQAIWTRHFTWFAVQRPSPH